MPSERAQKSELEKIAGMAMQLGGRHLADYGSRRSRHDFTQRQLMSCLILRAYLKLSYRNLVDLLQGHTRLRQILGLEEKLPHFSCLHKFSRRSAVVAIAEKILAQIGGAALRLEVKKDFGTSAVAIDSTGLEATTASAYFQSRRGGKHRRFVKVSMSVVCGMLLPVAIVVGWGPSNDRCEARSLLAKTFGSLGKERPARLYGDAGYDAKWIHEQCREQWGVEAIIAPLSRCKDGSLRGKYRSEMTPENLRAKGYSRRWQIESFFSAFKRTTGSALRARSEKTLFTEASLRVLA